MSAPYDLAVVGAGIVGLAHALAAARRGLRVVVLDREPRANGASIRNFGFVTVTGQQQGACWRRALRSRDVWAEIAGRAGIAIEQEGLVVVAQRAEAMAVLEAFAGTAMGHGCALLTATEVRARLPVPAATPLAGGLLSPHERRVESRTAIPRLAAWLAEAHGVTFLRPVAVHRVEPGRLATSAGALAARRSVVCPGDDLVTLFPERIASYALTRCKLHMLRLADPGRRLATPVMSDLSLIRYLGYAELPEAASLRRRLEAEQPDALRHGVHLIVVQSADGSLVVGDSHHYGNPPEPFDKAAVDLVILDELRRVLDLGAAPVLERWTGTYAYAADRLMLVDRPDPAIRVVVITSGTGASTAFAIAEEVVDELLGAV
jgi:FAD dependent oxidoreductase TIGR03364